LEFVDLFLFERLDKFVPSQRFEQHRPTIEPSKCSYRGSRKRNELPSGQ
jgi:hypothetical protein